MDGIRRVDMDPDVASELRRLVGQVGHLWKRVGDAAGLVARVGSPAAADEALPDARFVVIHSHQTLSSALDHLMAWKLLVDGNVYPIQADMTLLRAALEGAVRCRWLVDRSVDSATRVGRGYAAKRDDFVEHRKFEESAEGRPEQSGARRGKSATARVAELDAMESAAGIQRIRFESTTALMRVYRHERWFRLASAAAHGKEWVLAAADLVPIADVAPLAGVVHGAASANDEIRLALTRVTIAMVEAALEDFEHYRGGPPGARTRPVRRRR